MAAILARKSRDLLRCFRANCNVTFLYYCNIRRSIQELLNLPPETCEVKGVSVQGWVLAKQKHKHVTFLHVGDGTTSQHLQVVLAENVAEDLIQYGGSVHMCGDLVKSPGRAQNWEFLAKKVDVTGDSDLTYPISPAKMKQSLETTRGFLHLRSRSKINSSIFRVRNTATMAIHKFFQTNDFVYFHTPVLTSNDCEGAGGVFRVEVPPDKDDLTQDGKQQFFRRPVFLSVSGQLHLESFLGMFGKVYNFGPTFRAESSYTRHHLSEFYMVEGEIAFLENMESLLKVMEDMVKFTTKEIYNSSEDDMRFITKYIDLQHHTDKIMGMMEKEFKRVTYTEAIEILEKRNKKFDFKVKWGDDLCKEHEIFLVKHCGNIPVFLTDFPASLKPFYAYANPDNKTARAVDLLVPEVGELFGGTIREHRHDLLEQKLKDIGQMEQLQWYLDLRKYGTVPHGGFGMGFERYLQFILGIPNIKDTIPFPRTPGQCKM